MNFNSILHNQIHNYLLMPGDGTAYRFGFQRVLPHDPYTLDEGIGDGVGWIWYYINMGGGTGVGLVEENDLAALAGEPPSTYVISDQISHGMANVSTYTLVAVLLALEVLTKDPNNHIGAAAKMLDAPQVLRGYK